MKKVFKFCVVMAVVLCGISLHSCGSSWNIEGNNMVIYRATSDTIAPAGSYIMLPDTAVSNE